MKGKIWNIILVISAILSGIGNAIKIYEAIGDAHIKIDIAWLILAIIFIGSGSMYLIGKYREFKIGIEEKVSKIESDYKEKFEIKKELTEIVTDIRKMVDRVALVEKTCDQYATHYGQINIYGESKDKKE